MAKTAFFAYLTRLRWIKRWGLMRNSYDENVMEHSWEVAVIAHSIALIKNQLFNGKIDTNALTVAALYHDVTEVITGDLPTPIKYYSPAINAAYKHIEHVAADELCKQLPSTLQMHYIRLINQDDLEPDEKEIIKIADKISAYFKCQLEIKAGNEEFKPVANMLLGNIKDYALPEVDYFMKNFAPSCSLSSERCFA